MDKYTFIECYKGMLCTVIPILRKHPLHSQRCTFFKLVIATILCISLARAFKLRLAKKEERAEEEEKKK